MSLSARLFHCARCHCQVILCRRCDRGHVYCANGCAQQARKESLQRAGTRYRATRRGRLNNAARQRRFRARQQKVTHQGSAPLGPAAVLPVTRKPAENPAQNGPCHRQESVPCHRCRRHCSAFLRQDFLRSPSRVRDRRPP